MSNVDIDEVNKFAALASRWWDKNSEFKPLHDINPLRLNYIKEKCGGSLKDKRQTY
jgi:2-polyprenyl-6-hydroxyphenyl methylase/3-demethylubiquinone-9 3-methyltransferase